MNAFLLDTDTVSFALRGEGKVAETILAHRPSELAMSALTLAELRFGAEKRKSKKLHDLIRIFAESVRVLSFDSAAAEAFGKLSAQLARRGTPIGLIDTMIAAHALSSERVLVTNNTRHFQRVAGLTIDNWR